MTDVVVNFVDELLSVCDSELQISRKNGHDLSPMTHLLDDRLLHLLFTSSHVCMISDRAEAPIVETNVPVEAEGPDPNREDMLGCCLLDRMWYSCVVSTNF